jgi:hypothetical protein
MICCNEDWNYAYCTLTKGVDLKEMDVVLTTNVDKSYVSRKWLSVIK